LKYASSQERKGSGVPDPNLLGISEVGEATGLQSSALRYYEKAGLIRPAARAGGRRQYDPSVLQRLAAIALLQEAGFTIAEVRQLLGSGSSQKRLRSMAEQKISEIDAHVARVAAARELLVSALQCDCSGIDTCELVSTRRGRHQKVLQSFSP
jgi:MerR family transcriptional regulator, redox-sensitive transcriptional activator SoxR